MLTRTMAELITVALAGAGVERIWGASGDSLNELNESVRKLGKIQWMMTRHEAAAAFAAGAEASLTGKLSVCAGASGAGNLRLIHGLLDCHRNHAPVLAIVVQTPSSRVGPGSFRKTHPQELFRDCSHFVELVSNPKQLPEMLHRAVQAAIGRQGGAVIVVPGDVAHPGVTLASPVLNPPRLQPGAACLDRLVEILSESEAVTMLCGSGCAGSLDEIVALADRLGAPVVHALRGKEHVEWDNPFDVGMTGLIGFSSGNHAMKNCDTLLMLGTDFPSWNFYPANARIIHVDRDPAQLGKRGPLALGIVADVRETITAILPRIEPRKNRKFLTAARAHYQARRKGPDELAGPTGPGSPVDPHYIAQLVSELADEDAIFAADIGTPARHLMITGQRRLLFPGSRGSMANALPQALGAQAAFPRRQVISMSDGGGFAMSMGQLLSLGQLNLPVKIVLFENSRLDFAEMEQKAGGFLDVHIQLRNPDFSAIAKAAGVRGFRVQSSGHLEAALRNAFAHDGPALVSVRTASQEPAMPHANNLEQARGLCLYMLKAALNGRGDEIIEFARTNLGL